MEASNSPIPTLKLLGIPQVGDTPYLPTQKLYGILAYLALEGPTLRSKLAFLFWSDSPNERARHNLRQELHRLKAILGDSLLVEHHVVRLNNLLSDVGLFKDAVQHQQWAMAIAHYGGELLEGLAVKRASEFEEWLEIERNHLNCLFEQALLEQAKLLSHHRQFRHALYLYHQLLRKNRLSVEVHRQIIRLYLAMGDPGAALAQLKKSKRLLADEIGEDLLPDNLEEI